MSPDINKNIKNVFTSIFWSVWTVTPWVVLLTGNIDEEGCRRSIHCEGGALCVSGRCSCPSTHIAVAGNTKCAMRGGKAQQHQHQNINRRHLIFITIIDLVTT